MIRKLEEVKVHRDVPFEEDDVVVYPQLPARKIIVAHCYEQRIGEHRQWIVAEINGDTHNAADVRKVGRYESSNG